MVLDYKHFVDMVGLSANKALDIFVALTAEERNRMAEYQREMFKKYKEYLINKPEKGCWDSFWEWVISYCIKK